MVGDIITQSVYQKVVEDRHCRNGFEGVAISVSLLYDLRDRGVRLVRVIRMRVGFPSEVYVGSIRMFLESLFRISNPLKVGDEQKFVKFEELIKL